MELPPYVSRADGDEVEVLSAEEPIRSALSAIGFESDEERPDALIRAVEDDDEKAEVFAALRDLGVCFSWGREWSPAEVFQWLSEKGLIAGPFLTIGWSGPDQFEVRKLR